MRQVLGLFYERIRSKECSLVNCVGSAVERKLEFESSSRGQFASQALDKIVVSRGVYSCQVKTIVSDEILLTLANIRIMTEEKSQ